MPPHHHAPSCFSPRGLPSLSSNSTLRESEIRFNCSRRLSPSLKVWNFPSLIGDATYKVYAMWKNIAGSCLEEKLLFWPVSYQYECHPYLFFNQICEWITFHISMQRSPIREEMEEVYCGPFFHLSTQWNWHFNQQPLSKSNSPIISRTVVWWMTNSWNRRFKIEDNQCWRESIYAC